MSSLRKLVSLLTPKERRRAVLFIPFIVLSAIVEVVGVASVSPFLAIVARPEIVRSNRYLAWVYQALGFSDVRSFTVFVGAAVFVFIIVASLLTMATTMSLLRFGWMRSHSLSMRLLSSYLARPYVFYLGRHSADMVKNLISEVQQVVSGVLIPVLEVGAQGLVAVFILTLLVLTDPVLAVSVAIGLGGAYALIYALVRQRVRRIGKERLVANRARFQIAGDAFGGIKELKILRREGTFLERYGVPSMAYARVSATQQVIGRLPRYALEAIAFGGIVLVVMYAARSGRDLASLLPVVGLYAFSGVRLLPALQQVFNGLTTIRFNLAALDVVRNDLEEPAVAAAPPREITALPFRKAMALRGVSFAYPGARQPLFDQLSIEIGVGSAIGIVGETGSGKTTVIDVILGLLKPDAGCLEVDGTRIGEGNLAAWQANLGYVPQQIFLSDDTIARNIAFAVRDDEIDRAAVERAARMAQIHDFIVGSLPQGYDTMIGERGVRLSGGQRQRLGIARALYSDPELLVFDEATSALDSITEDYVFQAIASLAGKKTLLVVAHRLSTVAFCDTILLFDQGRIVARGTYEELAASSDRFRAMARIGAPHGRTPPEPGIPRLQPAGEGKLNDDFNGEG